MFYELYKDGNTDSAPSAYRDFDGVIGPAISGISPVEGPLATSVTITGTGFNDTLSLDTVWINGKQAVVTSATATQLVVTVPTGAGTGVVAVNVKGGGATGPVFTYDYTYQVTTLAGGNSNLVDGTGTGAGFGVLNGIANDGNGNLYLTDLTLGTIRKVTADKGVVTTIAGTGMVLADADGTLATGGFCDAVRYHCERQYPVCTGCGQRLELRIDPHDLG